MYKNENILFSQVAIRMGVIQYQQLQAYLGEYPQHSVLFSQWLAIKGHISQDQMQSISEHAQKKTNSGQSTMSLQKKSNANKEPENIGRYKVISVLGKGGMGKVYKVFDPVEQKELALKVILGHADQLSINRFKREAKTMAKLNHPGIIRAYDIGEENDQMFFTMDLVDGLSLKELQQANPMTVKQSIKFIIKICQIMDYAHKQGVIHRDLKPANIMIKDGEPLVMDFGLAKVAEASIELSTTGVLMGTLQYMAPEQAEGIKKEISAQTDLYSIGTILYELLARKPMFNAKTHLSFLNHILTKTPEPLSEINSKVSKALENICFKALAKQKKHRYQDCEVFAKELKKYNKETFDKIGRTSRNKKPAKKSNHHVIVGGLALFAIILLGIIISSGKKTSKTNVAKSSFQKSSKVLKSTKPSISSQKSTKSSSQKSIKSSVSLQKPSSQKAIKPKKSKDKRKQNARKWLASKIAGIVFLGKKTVMYNLKPSIDRAGFARKTILAVGVGGSLKASFTLYRKSSKKIFLILSHLSSRTSRNYSPITVTVNNKVLVREENPGSGAFRDRKIDITEIVNIGENRFSVEVSFKAVSNYWLNRLSIEEGE